MLISVSYAYWYYQSNDQFGLARVVVRVAALVLREYGSVTKAVWLVFYHGRRAKFAFFSQWLSRDLRWVNR